MILLHHVNSIKLPVHLDTGSAKHIQIVNIQLSDLADSLGDDYCVSLLDYFIFSGEDCTSSFKLWSLKAREKNPRFHKAFRQIGGDLTLTAHVMKQLEHFTYLVYGHISKFYVKVVHAKLPHKMAGEDIKLLSKSAVDLSRLSRISLLWSHTSSMRPIGLLFTSEMIACTEPFRIVLPVPTDLCFVFFADISCGVHFFCGFCEHSML